MLQLREPTAGSGGGLGQRRFPTTSSAPKHRAVSNLTARANDRQTQTGEPCWIRTSDLLIKSQLLYRLS